MKLHQTRGVNVTTASMVRRPDPAWERNWISYRHSLVMVDKRGDHHDTLLTVCATCGCETDLVPVPHSPRCTEPQ